eukprot:TRINITY_DN20092_c0_g1_i1.p1 TRINITY_DN20092_c0_g1~~TRINITY_DN20092_c0_g1_i1.p1  ORF type:complete len:146 (-),score=31.83 TRINITY_DN20092_c0_g1_i1:58-495(-)
MNDIIEDVPPQSKFNPNTKEDLIEFISRYQSRKFAEEVEFMESKEGDIWVEKSIETDFSKGLIGNDIPEREMYFGCNRKAVLPTKSYCEIFIGTLEDFTLRVLIGAAIISIILNMIVEEHKETAWIEGAAILGAVAISALSLIHI